VLMWCLTSPDMALHGFGLLLGGIGFVNTLIRLNVFWPTDASLLLANFLERYDLWNRAQRVIQATLLFRPLPEPLSSRERFGFRFYGLLAGVVTTGSIIFAILVAARFLLLHMQGMGAILILSALMVKYRRFLFKTTFA